MKEFFKIQKLDNGEKLLFLMMGITYILAYFLLLTQNLGLPLLSFKAFIFALALWGVCVLIDREKYLNIIDFLISILFGYGGGYFLLEIFLNAKQ